MRISMFAILVSLLSFHSIGESQMTFGSNQVTATTNEIGMNLLIQPGNKSLNITTNSRSNEIKKVQILSCAKDVVYIDFQEDFPDLQKKCRTALLIDYVSEEPQLLGRFQYACKTSAAGKEDKFYFPFHIAPAKNLKPEIKKGKGPNPCLS